MAIHKSANTPVEVDQLKESHLFVVAVKTQLNLNIMLVLLYCVCPHKWMTGCAHTTVNLDTRNIHNIHCCNEYFLFHVSHSSPPQYFLGFVVVAQLLHHHGRVLFLQYYNPHGFSFPVAALCRFLFQVELLMTNAATIPERQTAHRVRCLL